MYGFKKLNINKFRGIKGLSLDNLSIVNIIVGDNNIGKTSVLESIQLLKNPSDINNILRVAKQRDSALGVTHLPIFDNFINMFPYAKDCKFDEINISGEFYQNSNKSNDKDTKNVSLEINGTIGKVLVDPNDLMNDKLNSYYKFLDVNNPNEIDEFTGKIKSVCSSEEKNTDIVLGKLDLVTGREISDKDLININYLSSISHIFGSKFDKIIVDEEYKDNCVKFLQLFDQNIVDLILLRADNSLKTVEYIKNKRFGLIPLSTYGNGMKKVLSLLNSIKDAHDGILLIDEIETSINSKYYNKIFNFLIKIAKQYNVQLFITTQSIEAVDGLLSVFSDNDNYNTQNDPIRVITLRKSKDNNKTCSRIFNGAEVFDKRNKLDFDVMV